MSAQLQAVAQQAVSDPLEMEKKKDNTPQPNAGFYKSLLYQHAQKLSKQPPFYQTFNEGAQHDPRFISRVWIDDVCYTSTNAYTQRKAAETDVSKVAFTAIMQKTKDEAANLVRQDTIFCKSILIEYAVRMNLEKPSYQIVQRDASPRFSSSLVFNGNTYIGEFAGSKLEAQRLAARVVILSIIDSDSGNVMSEIVRSKFKMIYTALDKAKSLVNSQMDFTPGGVHTTNAKDMEVAAGTNGMPTPSPITEPCPGQPASIPGTHVSLQVTQPPRPATATAVVSHPVTSGPPILEQTPLVDSTIAVVSPTHLSFQVTQPPMPATATAVVSHQVTSVPPVLEQTPLVNSTIAVVSATDLSLQVTQPPMPATATAVVSHPVTSVPPILEQTPVVDSTIAVVSPIDLSLHLTRPPMPATATAVVSHPVTSVPPILEQTPVVDSTVAVVSPPITSAKRRNRKNKKKAAKKARVEAQ